MESSYQMTDLDNKLMEEARRDWPSFIKIIGENCYMAAKICLLKKQNLSHNQIAQKLHTTKKIVRTRSDKCLCEPKTEDLRVPE